MISYLLTVMSTGEMDFGADVLSVLPRRNPSRSKWRSDMLDAVKEECRTLSTCHLLQSLLVAGLSEWFHHDDPLNPYQMSNTQYPRALHRLIRQQNQIGWRHVFSGRLSQEWSTLQDNHYS